MSVSGLNPVGWAFFLKKQKPKNIKPTLNALPELWIPQEEGVPTIVQAAIQGGSDDQPSGVKMLLEMWLVQYPRLHFWAHKDLHQPFWGQVAEHVVQDIA